MCGIAGGINCKIDPKEILASLQHRGPDASGEFSWKNIHLLHARLAILDPDSGAQPMQRDGIVIVFNGEIYNHLELRKELREYSFESHSDTETLLRLYQKFGEGLFEYLDGMFAFAILDMRKNQLFLAVDRAGKKPLYYYEDRGEFFFASELNTIKRAYALSIEKEHIAAYLRSGFFFRSTTPYQKVQRLENAHWLRIDLESMRQEKRRYFSLQDRYREKLDSLDTHEALFRVESALSQSIERRILSSDREVGAFLSGGIDSSLVVAMASQKHPRLKTFTVAFEGAYDESHLAKLTAQRYATDHHTLRISIDLLGDLEKILRSYGMPFMDSSAIPSWYVSQEAKKYVDVVLNGDGTDELFAGYRRYLPVAHAWTSFVKPFSSLRHLLPKPHEKQTLYNYFYRLLSLSSKSGLDRYLSMSSDIFEESYRFGENRVMSQMQEMIVSLDLRGLDRALYLDFELLLFGDLLVKMDIATMAHSLEARSPFLSKEMLDLAPRLPNAYKIRGVQSKWILRELAKSMLDPQIVHQPKRGFEVPLKRWVDGILKESIFDHLSSGCYAEEYVERSFIQKLLQNRIATSAEKRAKMLWALYTLEVWYRGERG